MRKLIALLPQQPRPLLSVFERDRSTSITDRKGLAVRDAAGGVVPDRNLQRQRCGWLSHRSEFVFTRDIGLGSRRLGHRPE